MVPGQEVTLHSGVRGVLYMRTRPLGRRRQPTSPTWYFVPDGCAAVGVVVTCQPREIEENEVSFRGPVRPGNWPKNQDWLTDALRQAVYSAAMQGKPLPLGPAAGAA